MATELRAGGTAFLSFQNVLGHGVNPARKSEEEAQVRFLEADGERMVPRVIQVGTIGEFLGWVAPQEMVQGSEEGLAQRWETQWQEVLKAVQLLPPGFGTPHQSNSCVAPQHQPVVEWRQRSSVLGSQQQRVTRSDPLWSRG
ncbi:hypothetical protein E2320_014398 [Naja naja]|nr:hypothetical protein E2320_014398 [Naja naja]